MTTPNPTLSRPRRILSGFVGFAAVTIVIVAASGWILSLLFTNPRDGAAILISGLLAVATQLAAFPMVRSLAARNLTAGWGAGSAVRFGTLIVYAVLAPKVLLLPSFPALVSLAVFYFCSMVIEPLFFRP